MEHIYILITKQIDHHGCIVFPTTIYHFSTPTIDSLTLTVFPKIQNDIACSQIRFRKLDGSVSQDCPQFQWQPQVRFPGGLHFCLANYKFKGSHNPPFRINDLLEQFIEFRNVLYMLLQFIIKDTNEQPDE